LLAIGRYGRVIVEKSLGSHGQVSSFTAEGAVTSLAFSKNGDLLAAAGGSPGKEGQILLCYPSSGRRVQIIKAHHDTINAIAIRPGGRQLAAASYDRLVTLWPLKGSSATPPTAPTRTLRDHTDAVYGVAYSPNGKLLATCAGDRTVKVWNPDSGKRLYTLNESTAELYCVAFSPDGRHVAAGGVDKTLRIWSVDATSGTLYRSAFAHDGAILRIIYSKDGRSIFTCGEDNLVKRWDSDTLTERTVFPKQPDWPMSLALRPDGKALAVGRYDGTIGFYEVPNPPAPFPNPLTSLAGKGELNKLPLCESKSPSPSRRGVGVRCIGPSPSEPKRATRSGYPLTGWWGGACSFQETVAYKAGGEARGPDPGIVRQPGNESVATAQPVLVPGIVSGVLWNGKMGSPAPSHYYRFSAKKGAPLSIDVLARRTGSPLDSEIEVLDLHGRPIERAVLRAVGQTEQTLNDRDSVSPGVRLLLRPDFGMGDYILAGRELMQIYTLPKGPDDDYVFRSYRGQRTGMLGTTPEYHTIGAPFYKVEVHPPGSHFSPNGMPLTHLTYANDDGGPLYGRDSYLLFDPPADGDYIVRLSDVRKQQGEKYAYKLRIHAPRPDFNITFNPAVVTVPKDGSAVVSVECERVEGFYGEIKVRLEGLPTGLTATDAVIEAGEAGAQLEIAALSGAKVADAASTKAIFQNASAAGAPALKPDAPLTYRVVATAKIDGKTVERAIEPDPKNRKVVIGTESKLQVVTDRREALVSPSGEVTLEARITRSGGFKGRVPLDVRNLPYGVKVDDVGLNGVLINENETSRKFVIRCEPWVKPQTRTIYVTANVEGGVSNTALPITLHVGPGRD
jgi:hypothetical protein